jgi:hypothetical protein
MKKKIILIIIVILVSSVIFLLYPSFYRVGFNREVDKSEIESYSFLVYNYELGDTHTIKQNSLRMKASKIGFFLIKFKDGVIRAEKVPKIGLIE